MSARCSACLCLALLMFSAASLAAEVTIYRCTDDRGRLTLRDSPCLKGERQEARTMLRPQDPPARVVAPKAPAPYTPAAATTRLVMVSPPARMYECVTPDGTTYLSDSAQGEPRWEPGWAYGFPLHMRGHHRPGHGHDGFPRVARPRTTDGRMQQPGLVFDSIGRPSPKPPGDRPRAPSPPLPPVHGDVYAVGTWVRDQCQPLPQNEVCARLRDRRFELDRRYNSALQSERAQISQEQRGIDARLASDCARY